MDRSATRGSERITERVRRIEPQQIRVMFELATQHEGDLVHLEFGEPDFDTPDHIVEAAAEAAKAGRTKYTSNAGIRPLREAIADDLAADLGRPVDPDSEVVVTTGGVEALHLALLAVASRGAEVVIPTPTWPNPISQARLAGAEPVEVPMPADRGFAPDADRIVDAIGEETAAVLLTTPSNPTGRVFSREAIERVVEAAVDHDAFVLADEVYRKLVYEEIPPRVARVADTKEWVLGVDSCSKAYAMTGWRVGWLTGPADVLEQVTKIHESTTSCVNTPAQHAAIAALTGPRAPIREMQAAFRERRDYVLERLEEIPAVTAPRPEGSFYAFVDVSSLEGSSMAVAKRLLYDYDVVAAPGTAFGEGGEDHLRFSFANNRERLRAGLDRFEAMVRDEVGGT